MLTNFSNTIQQCEECLQLGQGVNVKLIDCEGGSCYWSFFASVSMETSGTKKPSLLSTVRTRTSCHSDQCEADWMWSVQMFNTHQVEQCSGCSQSHIPQELARGKWSSSSAVHVGVVSQCTILSQAHLEVLLECRVHTHRSNKEGHHGSPWKFCDDGIGTWWERPHTVAGRLQQLLRLSRLIAKATANQVT